MAYIQGGSQQFFLGLGVYLLKLKFLIADKLRFPWYYIIFSTSDQSLVFHWFPSNSCHHSNGNGRPLILKNVDYLEIQSATLSRNLKYFNYSTYTTCMRNKGSSFQVNHESFFTGWFSVIPGIFSNISRKIKLNTFSFQLKDLVWMQNILNVLNVHWNSQVAAILRYLYLKIARMKHKSIKKSVICINVTLHRTLGKMVIARARVPWHGTLGVS